jgi:hypothetical protein
MINFNKSNVCVYFAVNPQWLKQAMGIRKALERRDWQVLLKLPFGELGYDYEEGIKLTGDFEHLDEIIDWTRNLQSSLGIPYRNGKYPSISFSQSGVRKPENEELFKNAGLIECDLVYIFPPREAVAIPEATGRIKMFVARPVRVGGTGFCFVPEGELVKFGTKTDCMIGIHCQKGTTAIRVEEVEAKGLVQAFTKSIQEAWSLEPGEAQIEAENQIKEITTLASKYEVGMRLYVESYRKGTRLVPMGK